MMITMAPTQPPHWAPSPSSTTTTTTIPQSSSSSTTTTSSPPPSKLPVDFSPPLIAMVVIVATAFLIVTYSRLISRHLVPPILRILRRFRIWRHRRRRRLHFLPSSVADLDSPPFDPSSFHALSPYGLDESSIKTLPLSLFTKNNNSKSIKEDCAVCLLEFEENDYIRTLPYCAHAFHVDCIDIWLRSHANCPLCRAGIFVTESPFIPVMAARIRPSLDETLLPNITLLETRTESPVQDRVRSFSTVTEITPCIEESPRRLLNLNSEERFNNDGRDLLLKRSYSFGFERSLAAERMMVMEPATASPWRYRRGSFWNKRPSPFGSLTKSRVFSFRHYRGMKSPFFRRRGFFPLSERFVNGGGGGGGGGSSRRSKSMTSPMFMRSSGLGVAPFSSSRLRCGDPEALLSPERFNRR